MQALSFDSISVCLCSQLLELNECYSPEVSDYKVRELNSADAECKTGVMTDHCVAAHFRRERL